MLSFPLGEYLGVRLLGHIINAVCKFNAITDVNIVFQRGYTILQSHQQDMRVPVSLISLDF